MSDFEITKSGGGNVIVRGFQLDFKDSCRLPLLLGQGKVYGVDPTEDIIEMIEYRKDHVIEIPPKQPPIHKSQPPLQIFQLSCSTHRPTPPDWLSPENPDYYPAEVIIK